MVSFLNLTFFSYNFYILKKTCFLFIYLFLLFQKYLLFFKNLFYFYFLYFFFRKNFIFSNIFAFLVKINSCRFFFNYWIKINKKSGGFWKIIHLNSFVFYYQKSTFFFRNIVNSRFFLSVLRSAFIYKKSIVQFGSYFFFKNLFVTFLSNQQKFLLNLVNYFLYYNVFSGFSIHQTINFKCLMSAE